MIYSDKFNTNLVTQMVKGIKINSCQVSMCTKYGKVRRYCPDCAEFTFSKCGNKIVVHSLITSSQGQTLGIISYFKQNWAR